MKPVKGVNPDLKLPLKRLNNGPYPGQKKRLFQSSGAVSTHHPFSQSLKLVRGNNPTWDCSSTTLLEQPTIP